MFTMTTAVGRWSHECSHSSSCGMSTPCTCNTHAHGRIFTVLATLQIRHTWDIRTADCWRFACVNRRAQSSADGSPHQCAHNERTCCACTLASEDGLMVGSSAAMTQRVVWHTPVVAHEMRMKRSEDEPPAGRSSPSSPSRALSGRRAWRWSSARSCRPAPGPGLRRTSCSARGVCWVRSHWKHQVIT